MASHISARLAGRVAELELMETAFRQVSGGRQRTILLGAEAGGGKSRLIAEFVERVRDRALNLGGACIEQRECALPYAPFTAALLELVRLRGIANVRSIIGAEGTRELAWLLPEFGEVSRRVDAGTARARLFEVLRKLFEEIAREKPLILAIEDIHWADQPTSDLLRFLTARLKNVPVLLIVSYRPEDLNFASALRAMVADIVRTDGAELVRLPRLNRAEVATQLEGLLGHSPTQAMINQVHARGSGIPLFTEALVDQRGELRTHLPGSLSDFLLRAGRELPRATWDVLRTAALGGSRIAHSLLCRVAGRSNLAMAELLRPAIAAGILVPDGDEYAFRHALIHEAIRNDLIVGEVIAIHRAYAEVLENGPVPSHRIWHSVALARHWHGAGEAERTLTSAWQAAAEAASALAYPEQLQMLKLVLDAWPRAENPAPLIRADRSRVLELAADAACWAAEAEEGLAFVEEALNELDQGRLEERSAALLLQRAMMRQQGLLPGEITDLRCALGIAKSPTRLRAETLGQLCRALILRDECAEARRFGEELYRLAEELDDEEYKIEALLVDAHLAAPFSRAQIDGFGNAVARAKCAGFGRLEVLGSAGLLQALYEAGEYTLAIDAGQTLFARTVELGQARYMGVAVGSPLCRSFLVTGRITKAVEICEKIAALDPLPLGLVDVFECQAEIALVLGDLERVADAVRSLHSLPYGPQAAARCAASLLRFEIERNGANGELEEAVTLARTVPIKFKGNDCFLWPLLNSAVRVAVDAGQKDLVRQLADLTTGMRCDGAVGDAESLTFHAETSRANRSDLNAWEAAADAWAHLSQPARQAYALMRAGTAAINAGKRAAGAAHLRLSAETAERSGARRLLEQVHALAARARVRLKVDEERIVLKAPHGLTDRELEVLRLVAAGCSNRQIATDLFISSKTASVHVSNILGKLAVPTRSAAAAMAHRLHIVDPV